MTPYQRIKRAAKAGRGCRLTADECWSLYQMDDAIMTRANLDDEEDLTCTCGKAPADGITTTVFGRKHKQGCPALSIGR